jgi:hypothetical protein
MLPVGLWMRQMGSRGHRLAQCQGELGARAIVLQMTHGNPPWFPV